MLQHYERSVSNWQKVNCYQKFSWKGSLNFENNKGLRAKIADYIGLYDDIRELNFDMINIDSLAHTQIMIINATIPLLYVLIFKKYINTYKKKIKNYFRISQQFIGLLLVLSRRCGKTTVAAILAGIIGRRIPCLRIQLFASGRDQSRRILEYVAQMTTQSKLFKFIKSEITLDAVRYKHVSGETTITTNASNDVNSFFFVYSFFYFLFFIFIFKFDLCPFKFDLCPFKGSLFLVSSLMHKKNKF
jgi:hypothetical protein